MYIKIMKVALLTIEQKDELVGQLLQPDWYFNPILDGNEPPNWIISTEEIDNNQNPTFDWITELPLIDWVAPTPSLSV
jgi:hypothetical protein